LELRDVPARHAVDNGSLGLADGAERRRLDSKVDSEPQNSARGAGAVMTEPRELDHAFDDDPAGGVVEAMACRQFHASVIAGLALLAVAPLLMVRAPHVAPTEAARYKDNSTRDAAP
jgi:hypothetical protein